MTQVRLEMRQHAVLQGGRVVLEPGARAVLPLGLAVHLVRQDIAQPADDEATTWLCIALWLQEVIPPSRRLRSHPLERSQ